MNQKNKIFTQSEVDKAREPLKQNFSRTQLNSGLDSEIMQAGIELAGYHIEAGARSFADYSKAMVKDIGDAIKPYLRSFYEGVRYYPGFNSHGMSTAVEVDDIIKNETSTRRHLMEITTEDREFKTWVLKQQKRFQEDEKESWPGMKHP